VSMPEITEKELLMSYQEDRSLNVKLLTNKTKTLQFEIGSTDSRPYVENNIGSCSLNGNILRVEIDQKDLGESVNILKSLEILSTYNASVLSKLFLLQGNLIVIEIEMSENLETVKKETSAEVRLVYKIK
jgi:hypothetical protein